MRGHLTFLAAVCMIGGNASVSGMNAPPGTDGEWGAFRGPLHNGVSPEKGWPKQWPAEGLKLLWKADIGEGYSGIAISQGRVYAMGNKDATDTVFAFDAASGTQIWKHSYPCPSEKSYPGPRAQPVADGGRVYVLSRKGHLFCLDAAKGTVIWQQEIRKLAGGRPPSWDFSGSPLVYGNLLILNVNEAGVALDKNSGNIVWKSQPGVPGYATPVPYEVGGTRGVAIFAAKKLVGVNPTDGRVLCSSDWITSYDVNAADPVFSGDKVFIASGYGRGCAALKISASSLDKMWENKAASCHISSPVCMDGYVYAYDGQAGGRGALKCIEMATGKEMWRNEGEGGSLILSDGMLITLSYRGRLSLVEASPKAYRELASFQAHKGTCWTAPSMAGGRIYIRNKEGEMVCFSLTGK